MEFQLKLGNKHFTITEKDRVLFNGACYILVTQTYNSGWHKDNPTIAKAKAKKWIIQEVMVQIGTKNYGGKTYPLYKFIKEVE
ncbi:hypothetical protein [Streptococcus dysgalactiae]|uniref:Phage protein n=1 Tax=Streptococcus dysgalactiae TaxID=1334 RepID=A0ABU0A8R1_STRDY|nr:hypothetical protein [Streptococcus dysgalactiae]EGL47558.1 hypothetical protein HMPREF9964_2152 [Streptococcus dysgalactiae subsp. equisimilis SK1249]MDQ0263226.1 hypothetical protein [Streptococcus dysgalactiae]QQC55457.1 hypothetical protein I6H73_00090 [Streptococcus dysgalactiae]SUN69957.1 Uncharacterised protein [Streptococcus dysgalactiae]